MPTLEHTVSNRNGSQVMVKGLSLRSLGYRKDVRVVVSDPTGINVGAAWDFVVSNNEHATLTSKNPPPPDWIQAGVRVRIDVQSSGVVPLSTPAQQSRPPQSVSVETLAAWRRSLVQIISKLERANHVVPDGGVANRIGILTRSGHLPREVAQFMRTVTELRNEAEYNAKILTPTESEVASAAWRAIIEWAQAKGITQSF